MRGAVRALVACLLAACGDPPPVTPDAGAPDAGVRTLVILHTNDEHSHLTGFWPASAYPFLPEAELRDNMLVPLIAHEVADRQKP